MGNIGNRIFNHGRMSQVVSRTVVLKTGTTVYQCKDELAQAHEDYVTSLLNINDTDDSKQRVSVTKKFWSYVKSKRRYETSPEYPLYCSMTSR